MSAANVATPVTANVAVLGYGCIYEGGYLFSVDDTMDDGHTGACTSAPCTGSIGGKVVSITDQIAPSSGIIWSSNGATGSSNFSYDIIPGIDETSTTGTGSPAYGGATGFTFSSMFAGGDNLTYSSPTSPPDLDFGPCAGATDGQCNQDNILLFYNAYTTGYTSTCNGAQNCSLTSASSPATPLSYYAAGVCSQYEDSDGHINWYLPATCELDSVNGGPCTSTTPRPQSIAENLTSLLIGVGSTPCSGASCLYGIYWSSTERSSYPQYYAWYEIFSVGVSRPDYAFKNDLDGVRCVRAF